MKTARVNKKGADRVRQGHLWIYRSDVVEVDAEGGSIVSVNDERGNFIGQAFFSDTSQIALRFLTQGTKRSIAIGGDRRIEKLRAGGTSRRTQTPTASSTRKAICCRR